LGVLSGDKYEYEKLYNYFIFSLEIFYLRGTACCRRER